MKVPFYDFDVIRKGKDLFSFFTTYYIFNACQQKY